MCSITPLPQIRSVKRSFRWVVCLGYWPITAQPVLRRLHRTRSAIRNPQVCDFAKCVSMVLDPEIDAAYPQKWIGRVAVTTRDQRVIERRLEYPKGDPQNPLSSGERLAKFHRLASLGSLQEPDAVI